MQFLIKKICVSNKVFPLPVCSLIFHLVKMHDEQYLKLLQGSWGPGSWGPANRTCHMRQVNQHDSFQGRMLRSAPTPTISNSNGASNEHSNPGKQFYPSYNKTLLISMCSYLKRQRKIPLTLNKSSKPVNPRNFFRRKHNETHAKSN